MIPPTSTSAPAGASSHMPSAPAMHYQHPQASATGPAPTTTSAATAMAPTVVTATGPAPSSIIAPTNTNTSINTMSKAPVGRNYANINVNVNPISSQRKAVPLTAPQLARNVNVNVSPAVPGIATPATNGTSIVNNNNNKALSAPPSTTVIPTHRHPALIKQTSPALPTPATSTTASSSRTTSQSKKKKQTVTMATAASNSSSSATTGGENTGRWTADEHRLFLQGLEQHGKGWKKIASLIKSRTVVQIRTHAQKYFQKLAKARQNGEEGDVSMDNRDGRGGPNANGLMSHSAGVHGASMSGPGSGKRRRGSTGTKRKAISSVVASAEREGKRLARGSGTSAGTGISSNSNNTTNNAPGSSASRKQQQLQLQQNTIPTLPAVAPALSPFVYPLPTSSNSTNNNTNNSLAHQQQQTQTQTSNFTHPYQQHQFHNPTSQQQQQQHVNTNTNLNSSPNNSISVPSITTAHGTISGAALEDSLFRFLTPAPNETPLPTHNNGTNASAQVNDVARQAGANPITVPSNANNNMSFDKHTNNTANPMADANFGGDVSPTGVADINAFPTNWGWSSSDPPAWYAKGADVDELLNEAEALDWLADSGDLNETYDPPPEIVLSADQLHPQQHHQPSCSPQLSEPSLTSLVEPSVISLTDNKTDGSGHYINVNGNGNSTTDNNINNSNPNHHHQQSNLSDITASNMTHTLHKAPSVPILMSNEMNHVNGISPSLSAVNMPPLPSLFESSNDLNISNNTNKTNASNINTNATNSNINHNNNAASSSNNNLASSSVPKSSSMNLSSASLFAHAAEAADAVSSGDQFLLDAQFDEQAFVTALLDQDSSNNLLQQ